jgi:tape measure domain-containing protein
MAVNFDAILKIAAKVVGTEQITALRGSFQQVEGAASSLTSRLGPLIGLAGGVGLLGKIFGDTATLQTQTKSLEVLLGSADKATGIIKELQSYGSVTPFESTELIETAKRLNAFGIEGERVVAVTKRLGDIAGATGSNLGELATAYGQVVAKGKLQTEELLQFQERGVGIQGELQKMYNMSGEQLQKSLSKGEISAASFEQAIINLTATGGKYADGATAQSTTLNGRLSTLKDTFTSLSQTIGETMLPAFELTLNALTAVTGAIAKLPQPIQAAIGGVALLGMGLVVLAPLLASTISVLTTLAGLGLGATLAGWAGAMPAVTAGLAGIASTIASVATGLAALVGGFVTAPVLIGAAAVATAVVIFNFRDQIADAFRGLWDLIANPETGFVAMIGGGWNLMMDNISSYAGNILTNLGENWNAFIDTIIGPENGLIARLGQTWNAGMDAIRDYALGLVKPITDAWKSIVGTVRGVINLALSVAARGINAFIEQVNRLIQSVNSISGRVGLPQLGAIQPVEVPSFAGGGYTGNGPRSGGLDGQGGFMAMVHPQEQVIDLQRSAPRAAASGAASGSFRGGGTFAPTIQVQTGPVQQQPDGSQWIRREDAEAMVSDGIGQLWDHIQTYDGRHALGVA